MRVNIIKNVGCNPKKIKYRRNTEGFRDGDHSIKKDNNVTRILVVGDSFTYGQGIKDETVIFPSLLEQYLNQIDTEKKYEVFNFGKPGSNLIDKILLLEKYGLKYQPDIVIIQHRCWFGDKELQMRFGIKGKEFNYNTNSAFLYWLNYYGARKIMSSKKLRKLQQYSWQLYNERSVFAQKAHTNCVQLQALSKKYGFEILVVNFTWFPNASHWPSRRQDAESLNFITRISQENNFQFIDLYRSYQKYPPKKLRAHAFDSHPNILAHKIAAQEIFDFLITSM
ncbi:MAG: SGNH/GDSL hydrolase family protein [Candidatus Omnitrophica bacterium]|nr:SGNH/GDSL hydrolase family protein [Candidatus Omnitrophota bacterium]